MTLTSLIPGSVIIVKILQEQAIESRKECEKKSMTKSFVVVQCSRQELIFNMLLVLFCLLTFLGDLLHFV